MIVEKDLTLTSDIYFNADKFHDCIAELLHIEPVHINHIEVLKRSIDGRSKIVKWQLKLRIFTDNDRFSPEQIAFSYRDVTHCPPVIIVGAGPAGLFAALACLEQGLKPVILERGKDVSQRKHDIAQLSTKGVLNPDSNYCFGEGGAGTFSDGKLYTRSNKRGDVGKVLKTFVFHGADVNILVDSTPHIGSDKLPQIIQNIRETIQKYGGILHFDTKVTDILVSHQQFEKVVTATGQFFAGTALILATGHSADDMYALFDRKGWALESKPFAMGVRVEHPQALIDRIQYHTTLRPAFLPAARYMLATQIGDRGVFSFCMCPGGLIVPASTHPQQLVVNGMSNSSHNSDYANAGLVVTVNTSDYQPFARHKEDPLAGLTFRDTFERRFFESGGGNFHAPAQKMCDFVNKKPSRALNNSTYHRGLTAVNIHGILPDFIGFALRKALFDFDDKMHGYLTNDAQLIGLESRTSSPVRIPRNERLQHPDISNLYPCGEGSGYSGGIVSSAIDAINVILEVSKYCNDTTYFA
ncbi:FAD-dependent dehydrogenase [Bacteroidia bacterium]|nr:FAD-dependent dehydrogenase [Bacteroidia bacterium]